MNRDERMEKHTIRVIMTQMDWHVGDEVRRACAGKPGQHVLSHGVIKTGRVTRVGWTRVQVEWNDGTTGNYDPSELMHGRENA